MRGSSPILPSRPERSRRPRPEQGGAGRRLVDRCGRNRRERGGRGAVGGGRGGGAARGARVPVRGGGRPARPWDQPTRLPTLTLAHSSTVLGITPSAIIATAQT